MEAGPAPGGGPWDEEIEIVLRVPLRGGQATVDWEGTTAVLHDLTATDVTLQSGDVVLIPRQEDEVFFVVGPLDRTNVVNFTIRARDRQLGNAFLIPPDRDIDVVTAVAMAGYIDPINSPDTVTVHRQVPGCPPMLFTVDLIDARYNWRENMYIQPGDILYLNPDGPWWFRRTFDRIVPVLLTAPYIEAMMFWIPE
jgi:hypothetical protein